MSDLLAVCQMCAEPSQVKCSRCAYTLCGHHARIYVGACPRCAVPWMGSGDIDQLEALARIEHVAEMHGPWGWIGQSLSEALLVAERLGVPYRERVIAGRRGTARRNRATRWRAYERQSA